MLEQTSTGTIAAVSRSDPQLNVRIPARLKARIDEAVEASGRTLTAEVIRLIEAGLSKSDPSELERRVAELERSLKRR